MNDIISGTIVFALDRAIKDFENREDEAGRVLYESVRRSKAVWEKVQIEGIEAFGMSYERFLEQLEEKRNVLFLSDEEVVAYKKAYRIMEAMKE